MANPINPSSVCGEDSTSTHPSPVRVTGQALHNYPAYLIAGEDQTNNVLVVEQGQYGFERVEASQTAQALGATGAAGDFLHGIWIEANTGSIIVLDNATTVLTIPASTAIGFYEFNIVSSSGAWKITTAASTSCLAIGRFT